MYIETVELVNVRSYDQAKITLSPSINLIVGPNNSGKSTLLKSIYSLQDYNPLLTRREDIRIGEKFGRIFIGIKDINVQERYMFLNRSKGIGRKPTNEQQTIILSITESERKIGEPIVEQLAYEIKDNEARLERFRRFIERDGTTVTGDNIFPRFSSKENESHFIYPFFSKRKMNYYSTQGNKDAFAIYDDFRNLPSRIQLLSNSSHPRNKEYVQSCDDILGFQIGIVPGNDNEQRIGAFVTPSTYVYLESMGEGVANIVGLIVLLLSEDRKLYLIEELENDIHPLALKKLLDLILKKASTNQFVISTHSNIVLKNLAHSENTKIFKTTWHPMGKTSIGTLNISTTSLEEVANTPTERLNLLSSLGYDLFDFELYKSYILFEESSAERITKEFLIPWFTPELINKLKTIAAGGTADLETRFIDFHRLFVYVHATPIYKDKIWVLADGDESGINCIESLKKRFSTWCESNFINFSKRDFEEYYPERFYGEVKSVLSIKDKQKKREEKRKLLESVVEWMRANASDAKKEFKKSAEDVISVLKLVSKNL